MNYARKQPHIVPVYVRVEMPRFGLGKLRVTPCALGALRDGAERLQPEADFRDESDYCAAQLRSMLTRHIEGDWGNVSDEVEMGNESACKHGRAITSCYPIPETGELLYVITNDLRTETTVLAESECPVPAVWTTGP